MTPERMVLPLGFAFLFFLSTGLEMGVTAAPQEEQQPEAETTQTPPEDMGMEEVPSNLLVEVFQKGDCEGGAGAKEGDILAIHYQGRVFGQTKHFSASSDEGSNGYTFTLGAETVVKGWNVGLLGVCVGEHRTLTIPPHLGYGAKGVESVIPADSTLIFDIVVLSINAGEAPAADA